MSHSPLLLADAAAVEPRGEGRFDATLVSEYCVFDKPHGGYLQCIVANAAVAAAAEAGAGLEEEGGEELVTGAACPTGTLLARRHAGSPPLVRGGLRAYVFVHDGPYPP